MQMAGRGLRPKSHTDHCLVLDFAGAVKMHGPITAVKSPSQKVGSVGGEALVKVCSHCSEICYTSQKCCHVCGDEFPIPEMKQLKLDADADIMGEMAKANNLVSFARIGPRGKPAAIFNWNEVDKLIEDGFSALDIANKSGTALSTFCQAIKREFQISFSEYSREKLQKRNARQARYRQKQGRSRLELMVTPELQERFKSLAGLENMTNYEKLKILCDSWDKYVNQESKNMESVKKKLINRINSLSELKDGWRDGKATAIPKKAIQNAISVLDWIEEEFLSNISIVPMGAGEGVNFETYDCPFQLQFDVYADRVEQTLWTDDHDGLTITIPMVARNV